MKNDYFFRSPFFLLTLYKLMCVKATVGYLQIPFLTFFSHFLRAQTNVHYLRLGVLSHTKSFFLKIIEIGTSQCPVKTIYVVY